MARHKKNGEISFSDAMNAIRQWYHDEVKEWADDFDKRIADGDFDDREDFIERFDEETDSAQVIIYTSQAKAVLLASDNEDAYEDEIGDSGSASVEARALMAFRRDIMERMDSDIDDDDTFEQEEEDDDDE